MVMTIIILLNLSVCGPATLFCMLAKQALDALLSSSMWIFLPLPHPNTPCNEDLVVVISHT